MKSNLTNITFFILFPCLFLNAQNILPAKKSTDSLILSNYDSNFFVGLDFALGTKSVHINLINIGYYFNNKFGITSTVGNSFESFNANDPDVQYQSESKVTGVIYYSIGPIINNSFGNINWEFKPQYSYGLVYGSYPANTPGAGFGLIPSESTIAVKISEAGTGQGFIIGNTLVKKINKRNRPTGFIFVINIDYLNYTFFEVQGELRSNVNGEVIYGTNQKVKSRYLRSGFGIRYNF